jgi:hypothetical protein
MIKVYPEIIFQATNENLSTGGFRLWFLGKDFDPGGSGMLPSKKFRKHLARLGVTRPTFYRWLDEAKSLGLIVQLGPYYRIAAWGKGAQAAGLARLKKTVYVPRKEFVNKGWLAVVWDAFRLLFGNTISRATLEQETGVPARTQRHYESQTGGKVYQNYADMGDPKKDPKNAVAVDEKKGVYGRKNGHVGKRLPNTYMPEGVLLAAKGRTNKVNRYLRSCDHEGSLPLMEIIQRLYCETDKQLKSALRMNRKHDYIDQVDEVFKLVAHVRGRPIRVFEAVLAS